MRNKNQRDKNQNTRYPAPSQIPALPDDEYYQPDNSNDNKIRDINPIQGKAQMGEDVHHALNISGDHDEGGQHHQYGEEDILGHRLDPWILKPFHSPLI